MAAPSASRVPIYRRPAPGAQRRPDDVAGSDDDPSGSDSGARRVVRRRPPPKAAAASAIRKPMKRGGRAVTGADIIAAAAGAASKDAATPTTPPDCCCHPNADTATPPKKHSAWRGVAHVAAAAGASLVFNSSLARLQHAIEHRFPPGALESLRGAALSVFVGLLLMLTVAWLFDK